MKFSKKIEKYLIDNGFKKEKKEDVFIPYVRPITDSIEYLFVYFEQKSKYHFKGAPLHVELTCGLRFSKIENIIHQNNKEFLMAHGWKEKDYKFIKYPSICERICNSDESDELFNSIFERLEKYVSYQFDHDQILRYKNQIIGLNVPIDFSFYNRTYIAMRALVFMHLDGGIDESQYAEWFAKYPDLSDNPKDKWSLDQLKSWLNSGPKFIE